MQLGRFGPGADPTRSKAAYPPPRLVLDYINPESLENQSKLDRKSIEHRSKIDQKSIKNPPRELREASWGLLGHLGVSWGRLGASCGRPWGVLARKRWPTWFQLGPQNGARIEKKSKQKSIKILMALGVKFLKDFGGFGMAKWSQVGTRIASKIDPNFERRCFEKTLFFLRKNNDFEGSGGRSWDQKSIKNR